MEGNLEMIETNPSPYIFEICSSAIKRKNQPIKQPTNKVKEWGGRWCFRGVVREGLSEKVSSEPSLRNERKPIVWPSGHQHFRLRVQPWKVFETGMSLGYLEEWDSGWGGLQDKSERQGHRSRPIGLVGQGKKLDFVLNALAAPGRF